MPKILRAIFCLPIINTRVKRFVVCRTLYISLPRREAIDFDCAKPSTILPHPSITNTDIQLSPTSSLSPSTTLAVICICLSVVQRLPPSATRGIRASNRP
ncbi:hypothetical protein MSAN_00981200 [Mycena sanguinolenta]|uniref:Uncharacterized protein n=1 Tax=Mycena sanguinolenta TaxID=230812 RepID=A0A8H7D9G5_9AGAR|nr:hypothetical protein MSAN_00981200 [Mycena sanguinolenta]